MNPQFKLAFWTAIEKVLEQTFYVGDKVMGYLLQCHPEIFYEHCL